MDLVWSSGAVPATWADFIAIKWVFKHSGKKIRVIWRYTVMAVAWLIWLERNKRVFEDKNSNAKELWSHAKFLVGMWAKASKIFDSTDQFLFRLDCDSFMG